MVEIGGRGGLGDLDAIYIDRGVCNIRNVTERYVIYDVCTWDACDRAFVLTNLLNLRIYTLVPYLVFLSLIPSRNYANREEI